MSDERVAPEVKAYLANVPEGMRPAIEHLRATISAVIPEAREVLSYQLPTFTLRRHVVAYGAFKRHCSLFPLSSTLVSDLAAELAPWTTSAGTIQFTPSHPISDELVRRIVALRLEEIGHHAA